MKKVIHTHNYTKLAGGQHEENGTHNYIKLAGGQHEENGKRTRGGEEGEREMDERRGEERRRGKELKSEC